jgi:hypothetical protein
MQQGPAAARKGVGWPLVVALGIVALAIGAVVGAAGGFAAGLGAGQPALAEAQRERDTAKASLETAVLDLQGTKADLERERSTSATCGAVFSDVDAVIKTWVEFLKAEQAYARTSVGSAAERRAGAKLDKMFDTLNGKIVSLQPDVTACRTDGA